VFQPAPLSESGASSLGMRYSPESQRRRSSSAQRREQNGTCAGSGDRPQIGHFLVRRRPPESERLITRSVMIPVAISFSSFRAGIGP